MKQSKHRSESKAEDRARKHMHIDDPRFIMIISIIALLVIALFLITARHSINSSVVFLYSDRCSNCNAVEPEIKDIVSEAGLKFYKAKYDEPGYAPGVIVIYDDRLILSGYRDGQSLKQQLCGFTRIKKACVMAGESWE